jgi:hypothetical protein
MLHYRKRGMYHSSSPITEGELAMLRERYPNWDEHFEVFDPEAEMSQDEKQRILDSIEMTTNQERLVQLAGHKVKAVSLAAEHRLMELNG